jgi:hypothetical protein
MHAQEPVPRPEPNRCCCRSEHIINAGCKIHGVHTLWQAASEELASRRQMYRERRVGEE